MFGSWRHAGLCIVVGWALAAPATAADPLLMLLLSVARQIAEAELRKSAASPSPAPLPATASRYPGTSVEPDQLRQLIDECFTYLSAAQRSEVFDSLNTALGDPKNAAMRGAMIDYFVVRAVAIRDAQQRLSRLDPVERERLVANFRTAVAAMPADEAAQLADMLRLGVLPVPVELNAQLLAALPARP